MVPAGWPGPADAGPGARLGRRARGRAEAPSMAPQPLLDVLSRIPGLPLRGSPLVLSLAKPTPCARHPSRLPSKGTGTGSPLRDIAASCEAARAQRCCEATSQRLSPSARAGVVAVRRGWLATDGQPRPVTTRTSCQADPGAQPLRRGPARQGRRGSREIPRSRCHPWRSRIAIEPSPARTSCPGVRHAATRHWRVGRISPSLWFLSLGKQRKEPAPGEIIDSKRIAAKVRNPDATADPRAFDESSRQEVRAPNLAALQAGGLPHA